ncbi:MAG: cysteine desulfurase NifS [Candidatus Aenigmatarchaeota archaeon]|nr:MAG: cysteine desulfurase NifS [Candidatus Aenigmarchaeota archaeon]
MKVYMDYAATTPVDPRVFKVMRPYFSKKFGNTMSLHSFGREAKKALEDSRERVAKVINANPSEIIFTSGATESNNLALKGVAFANKKKGKHLIVSSIEHHCVLDSARWLEKQGFEITYLKVDKYGLVDLAELEDSIREDTILVSIMHANNEIGTIEPIKEIGKICREKGVYFHTDAAQSFGKVSIDVKKMNVDLLTASSHKIYGPKGVGFLFIREGVEIEPLLHGGGHEFGLRSSTVNVAGIVGFAEAAEIARKEMKREAERLTKLRRRLERGVLKIKNSHLNGHPTKRLPNISNFWFDFIEGEALVMYLDQKGIAASTGSACSSESLEPSHVLLAIGLKPHQAQGSLRLSIGRFTTKKEVDYVLKVLPEVVERLRRISPFKGKWS